MIASHPTFVAFMQSDDEARFKWSFLADEVVSALAYFKHGAVSDAVVLAIVAPRARYELSESATRDQYVRGAFIS